MLTTVPSAALQHQTAAAEIQNVFGTFHPSCSLIGGQQIVCCTTNDDGSIYVLAAMLHL